MNRANKSESLLIQRIQVGDEYAFEIVFLKYREPLCRYIWKFVRSTALAEEIAQDVFADIWNDKEDLNPAGHLRGLIFEIARNKALDHIKHQKVVEKYLHEATQFQVDVLAVDQLTSVTVDDEELNRIIKVSIGQLPARGRQIFDLNRKEGLTYLEISEYLDISVKTVETHMRRAFQKLRESLGKHFHIFLIGTILTWSLLQMI